MTPSGWWIAGRNEVCVGYSSGAPTHPRGKAFAIMGQRPKLLSFSGLSEHRSINQPVIGHRANGAPIFLIAGGDGEDDDDEDTDKATVPVGRYLKLKTRMQAADRRANAAEAKVAELEPIAAKVPELEKQVENGAEQVKLLRIDNAFLTSDIAWVDPEAALKLADLSEVEIKEDGTVKGLVEALSALAEKKPFLVKPKDEEKGKKKGKKKDEDVDDEDEDDEDEDEDLDDDDDEDDEDDNEPNAASGGKDKGSSSAGGVSGTSTGSGKRRRKGGKGPTDAELMSRYRI